MNVEKTGEFIRNLRKEKNLTQQQLAGQLGVSDKAVSRWETGRGFPDIGNVEDIAGTLGVSVAEIIKGERFNANITEADVAEVSSASFSMARNFVAKKKWMNLAIGFLSGMIIIILLFIHLTSPIPIKNAENALSVDTLADKEIAAVLESKAVGYEISDITDPDTKQKYVFISCHETILNRLFGNSNKTVAILGDIEEVDYVYYYPADKEDQLVWQKSGLSEPSGGVVTLPRLVYNYWIIIGTMLSFAGIVLCILFRKKRFLETIVKITMAPVAFTISIAAVLAGRFGSIYSASYYFSGILLLTIVLYVFFVILFSAYKTRRKEKTSRDIS
ncbi:MAG: helix-turn-helix domain-containing protein [Lachnospiraceae bacterium]|jgi:transcriptional regulator with XRE-family HTH domain